VSVVQENTVIFNFKAPNVDSIDQYRPIALANFKFKIITKVLGDRLSQILPSLISKEQRGFIKGWKGWTNGRFRSDSVPKSGTDQSDGLNIPVRYRLFTDSVFSDDGFDGFRFVRVVCFGFSFNTKNFRM
jgi:hypothetical protein